MDRSEVLRILLTDERVSHAYASGVAGQGVSLIAGKGLQPGHVESQIVYCGNRPLEQKDYWCRLHVSRSMKRSMLFFTSVSAVTVSLIYPKNAGARRSVGGYGVHVPTSDAQVIEQAVMGDPTILLTLFEQVFPKEFAKENKGHPLQMDPNWDKNVSVKVF
ncbi:hypothetical protein C4580_01325 [Candidatus Woesearchaeota archaeon]|nr:MAG: hypothetical protein C4580_01325 [Candidatus Woesearchaeota archaeon]